VVNSDQLSGTLKLILVGVKAPHRMRNQRIFLPSTCELLGSKLGTIF
jgi:hypothetical protein